MWRRGVCARLGACWRGAVGVGGASVVAGRGAWFGDGDLKWRRTLLVAATLAVGSSIICVVLLRQTIPLFGFWF